jgi:hypothetical protein
MLLLNHFHFKTKPRKLAAATVLAVVEEESTHHHPLLFHF